MIIEHKHKHSDESRFTGFIFTRVGFMKQTDIYPKVWLQCLFWGLFVGSLVGYLYETNFSEYFWGSFQDEGVCEPFLWVTVLVQQCKADDVQNFLWILYIKQECCKPSMLYSICCVRIHMEMQDNSTLKCIKMQMNSTVNAIFGH